MTISSEKGTHTQYNMGQLIMMKMQGNAEQGLMTESGDLHNFRVLHLWNKSPLSLISYRKKQVTLPQPEDVDGDEDPGFVTVFHKSMGKIYTNGSCTIYVKIKTGCRLLCPGLKAAGFSLKASAMVTRQSRKKLAIISTLPTHSPGG